MNIVKTLLGVRKTTPNDTCLVEVGLPTAKAYVQNAQLKYFNRVLDTRTSPDDPLAIVLKLCRDAKTPCARYLDSLVTKTEIIVQDSNETKERIRQAGPEKTKIRSYLELNPDLVVSSIYLDNSVNELQRIKASRLRLSSHKLAIETGRWSRIPRDQRLCHCGEIQTEHHVICECRLTAHCRTNLYANLVDFFKENPHTICRTVAESLSVFGQ